MTLAESRLDFYRRIQQDQYPCARWNLDNALEAYSFDNEWARKELAKRRSDSIKVGESESQSACAQADFYQSCADATHVVGDVVTGGAHRNVQQFVNELKHNNPGKASLEFVKGGAKVAWSAITAAPGEALKAAKLGVAARLPQGIRMPLGNWALSKKVIAAGVASAPAQKLSALALKRWPSLVATCKQSLSTAAKKLPGLTKNCKRYHKATKPVRDLKDNIEKWGTAAARETHTKCTPVAAIQKLQAMLSGPSHGSLNLKH